MTNPDDGNKVSNSDLVDQLTAIGLITFELIEATEERYPAACEQLKIATNHVIDLINDLIIDEYMTTATIIPTPRFNTDVSFEEGNELEDIGELVRYLKNLSDTLSTSRVVGCRAAIEAVYMAQIFVLQTKRPYVKSDKQPEDPWAFLERMQSNQQ